MDGVLADFFGVPNAVERFKKEKHFFRNLAPISINVDAVRMMIEKGEKVIILTTSPHRRADRDKRRWLKVYLPQIKTKNIIFARPKIAKIEYVNKKVRAKSILMDDYGKNIREWVNGGGIGVKILGNNERNQYTEPYYAQYKNIPEYVNIAI